MIRAIGLIFRGVVEPRARALDGLVTSCDTGDRDIEGILFAGDCIVGGVDTFHHGGGDVVFEERGSWSVPWGAASVAMGRLKSRSGRAL